SVRVRMFASGTAWTAEIPNPLAQTASNPASSASLALRASWAPAARRTGCSGGDCRKRGSKASRIGSAAYTDRSGVRQLKRSAPEYDVHVSAKLRRRHATGTSVTYRSVSRRRIVATAACPSGGSDADVVPEPTLVRRLRRGRRRSLPGEA